MENTKAVLSYMVGLYDCLNVEALNGDWSQVDLSVYKTNFDAALEMLKNSSYKNYESRFVTKQVSESRENDDYFELVYEYFYNLTDETEKEAAINVLKDIALPGELEDLYVAIRDSMYQINYFANWANTGVWDTTEFITLLASSNSFFISKILY